MNNSEVLAAITNVVNTMPDDNHKAWTVNYLERAYSRHLSELKTVEKFCKGPNIAEVGSLPYFFTAMLKTKGHNVVGVDVAPNRSSDFIKKFDLEIRSCNIEIEELPFEPNSVDFIVFNEVFEHLRINPISTLLKLNSILKEDGRLMLSTPNLYYLAYVYRFITGKGFDKPYFEFNKLNTIGHMGHVRMYTMQQVVEFLANTGFNIVYTSYQNYDFKRPWLKPLYSVIPALRSNVMVIAEKKRNA